MIVYHGGYCAIETPEILQSHNNKDFGQGFYCTDLMAQAERWAKKYQTPSVSVYEYVESNELTVLSFDVMSEEWLDFIINCRKGNPHNYDIVTGAMANDQIWNFIGDYASGVITRKQFWVLAEFKYPTHQIAFCTSKSLSSLKYNGNYEVRR